RLEHRRKIAQQLAVILEMLDHLDAKDLIEHPQVLRHSVELAKVPIEKGNPVESQNLRAPARFSVVPWHERDRYHLVSVACGVKRKRSQARAGIKRANLAAFGMSRKPSPSVEVAETSKEDGR